ncbi:3719_t:CDS:2 [Dentiscutata erythropus]|uniref:ATP-dependent DNA helicase n=1 Tax=Dentiscutata erythropus TaxID=1348616 RepID=A0A9N9IPX8_9GLOM|nr:3719_t:CDS:2 [Dentiscutata erythropus]
MIVLLCGKGLFKKNDTENAECYSLFILMLFKPWETIQDLLENYDSWAKACQAFLDSSYLSPRLKSIIYNIKLLYKCSEETALDRELRKNALKDPILAKAHRIDRSDPGYNTYNELDLSDNDELPINNTLSNNILEFNPEAIIRSGLKTIKMVDSAMSNTNFANNNLESETIHSSNAYDSANNTPMNTNINLQHNYKNTPLNITVTKNTNPLEQFASGLNEEQKKAYFLFCEHRQKNNQITKNSLLQLLLYFTGAGGTGKSRVIQAICSYFEYTLQSDKLIVLAPTGIAAVNICGNTIHSACGFGFNEGGNNYSNFSNEYKCQLQECWSKIEYAILDELSIVGQNLLAQFHTFIKKIKFNNDSTPFARINILFARDFIQSPPVLDKALYTPDKITCFTSAEYSSSKSKKRKYNINLLLINSRTVTNTTGRSLWLNVKHAVQLNILMRQIDNPFYTNILENMYHSNLTETQIAAL